MRALKFGLALILSGAVTASAATRVEGVPNLFEDVPERTAMQALLGNSCHSLEATRLDLNCNPAFLPGSKTYRFHFNAIGTDQLAKLNNYRQDIEAQAVPGVVDDLLHERGPLVAKASLNLWLQQDWWVLGYTPLRAGFTYLNRNPAFPEISTLAFREWEVFGQAGAYLTQDPHFRFGVQSRLVKREYIYQQFYALDALADPNTVELRGQTTLYLEPSFVYEWSSAWKPQLAGTLRHLMLFQSGDQLPNHPIFELGFSSTFGELLKNLRTTTHFSTQRNTRQALKMFSWSGLYDFENDFQAAVTLGQDLFGAGASARFAAATVGLTYKSEAIFIDNWSQRPMEQWLLEIGLIF